MRVIKIGQTIANFYTKTVNSVNSVNDSYRLKKNFSKIKVKTVSTIDRIDSIDSFIYKQNILFINEQKYRVP